MPNPEAPAPCVHWWIIETPNGATSTGRCKYCGAEREFKNVFEPDINQIMRGERQIRVDNLNRLREYLPPV